MRESTVVLFDVDNTLLDNDRFATELTAALESGFGSAGAARYWSIYENLRDTLGYADYLGALQRFRIGMEDDPQLYALSAWLLDYPFERLLYPQALEAVASVRRLGRAAILSDGDAVFQPRKIARSGLAAAFGDDVLVFVHKERSLDAMQRRLPAAHYVMLDDKPTLLAAMKRVLGARLTTVFVRQGHYARQADLAAIRPPPDRAIERIGGLAGCDPSFFRRAAPGATVPDTTESP